MKKEERSTVPACFPPTGADHELAPGSMKSIDMYSAVDNSLMDDLRKSYPLEDMRRSLANLPENLDIDGLVNCSRSYSTSSYSQAFSQKSNNNSFDVLVVDY